MYSYRKPTSMDTQAENYLFIYLIIYLFISV